MVKKIINIAILVLFAARLFMLNWSGDAAAIINQIATLILAAAAGIALSNLIPSKKERD
ncbi:hypothetical protein [Acetanaerobacterium elongatum]|uniref:hypothetical protein n=1 Tax=Acetanaerobacterium elongatum TaxID=258515 RepID=UPI0013BE9357|nr:hypothetical protein [Acetanaerobacterium elongatum]